VNIVIERDVPVVMRDGVTLRANVYRPAEGGPFPVIMERTPYGKDAPRPSAAIDAVRAAGQGVAVVVQDVRGQASSEGGSFYMFRDEFADGFDSVEWAAAQPFCNGHVGLYGTSYGANTSWQAAIADPPALGAIAPTQAPIDYVEGWPWLTRDGVLKWGLTLNWTLAAIVESQIRRHSASRELDARMEAFAAHMMKKSMSELELPTVREMLDLLVDSGAELYGCELAMKMFKRTKDDLVPQVKDVITAGDFYDLSAGAQIIFT